MLLLEQLKQIPDHRGLQGRKYPLWILMALVIIGTFCGHVGYRPLGSFCQKYREQLWSLREIEESFPCPSYSTLRRTLLDVPPERWETVFNVWALATLPHRENRCVSIDGKSIKCTSSGGQTNEQDFVSIVSLYAHEEDVRWPPVVGQF